MKKVLSFVLVLSMILGSFSMAFAAPATDTVGLECEDAANVLTELGVIGGYKDGTFRPENIVTRAEMATMIVKALGLNDYAVGKSSFTDMAGHWADPYVAYAVSLGFIAGYSDNTFKPDAPVTADQAITMLVQAIGYKGEYLTGGYPGAFVNQALTLGMLDGIKSGAAGMDRGSVAILIFNTLDAKFVRYDKDGGLSAIAIGGTQQNPVYDTMLGRLGVDDADDFDVILGNEASAISLKEYQGASAKVYKDAEGDIIAISEVQSVFVTGEFATEGGLTFTTTADVEYKFDNRATTAAVAYFENGSVSGAGITYGAMVVGDDYTLAVKTSGKYITEVYSIAKWVAADTIKVDADDVEELAESDKLDGQSFAMTDDDEIDMDEVILVGADALADIKEDDIVTYYMAAGEIVKVEVSDKTVEGSVKKINNDAATKVTIGGNKYDVASPSALDATLKLGDEGTFFLNYAGDIFAFEGVSKAENYAIITYSMDTERGTYASDSVYKVKMMTADGTETIFTVDEDATAVIASKGSFTTCVAVKYTLDKDGEIDTMVPVATAAAAELTAKGYLDGYKVSENVVVYEANITSFAAAQADLDVVDFSKVPVKEDLKNSMVIRNTDNEVVVIILDKTAGEAEDGVYGVIVETNKIENADDKKVWEVKMFVNGETVVYVADTAADALVSGKATSLLEIVVNGGELTALNVTTGATNVNGTVSAIKDGNLKVNGTYQDIASDVVVYELKDGDFVVSSFAKIGKKDDVKLFEMDGADDKDGFDIIIFEDK